MPDTDYQTAAHLIHRWREKLVLLLLKGIFLITLLATLIGIPFYLISYTTPYPSWIIVGVITPVVLLVILGLVTFLQVPYTVRALGALFLPFMFYLFGLFDTGAAGDTLIMLQTFIVLTFMLLGKRAGFVTIVISVFLYIGVAWGMVNHKLTVLDPIKDHYDLNLWIVFGVEVFCVIGMLTLGVVTLQDAFATAHQREREALEDVSKERTSLEVRVRERTHELEQAYLKLRDNQEVLLISEKMASLGRLTAGFVNEMNTPLATVRASHFELKKLVDEYAQSIGGQEVGEEEHHEIAREMVQTLGILERGILRAMSFISSVKLQTHAPDGSEHRHFQVVEVVEEALLLLDHRLMQANCQVKIEQPTETIELVGSVANFTQIIIQLITNAIDASIPKGGGEITIALENRAGAIKMEISDQGVGISEEIHSKVFDPLFTTKPFDESTGLGLSIVHDIVTKHFGGSIDFVSQVGTGTTFTLVFPIQEQ